MSFAMFCPSCANQTAYLKHTFHTICQQLLFHLLFAPVAKAKIFIPISRNPKRKAGNKQFSSRWLLNASQRAPLTPLYVNPHSRPQRGEGGPGQDRRGRRGLAGGPSASQKLPEGEACTSRLPRPSHSLIRALMDIKNRTKQDWRWEQNPCTTGLDRRTHSAVKCKNKKGQTSCIPQDASRFFNIVVPPHISLRMLHYIYMSLKYLPFF